ncbi:hypothetical protein FACS1894170_07480 [Planctomycetales bacterium]|nr:hypothetical protein FACS1894170_07480 [Planctomycetales bacterium]
MTSGTFGVAWLDSDGYVQVFDGQKSVPLPVIKTYAVGAADLLEEGSDQLIFFDEPQKGLNIYSFKTNTKIGPFGSNVKTFAVGRLAKDETFPSFFACTSHGDTFRWTKDVMGGGWIPLSGMFSQASAGNLDSRSNLNEFVTVSEGNVYIYSPQWDTYGKAVEGKNIIAVLTGNVTASPGNEIVMLDKSDNVWLHQNGNTEDLKQKASCLTFGKNGSELDTLYALDAQRKPVAYDRESKTWKSIITQNAFACSGIITKTNPDGKGHTLYAVRDGSLYRVNAEGAAEQLSEQKSTKVILKSGDKPVAEYRFVGVPFKPYIEKLRTPSGRNVLRDAPHDHLHHHGLMFAIAINGCNFWEEFSSEFGKELTVSIKPQAGSETDVVESELDWNTKDAKTLVKEDRKISVSSDDKVTLLDWHTTLKTGNEGVILDKSNHHYFGLGIRFDESMDEEGRFFDVTGKNDGEVFRGTERLTPCRWMAYTAKLDGKPVTVAVLGNPKNSIPTMAFTMGGRDNVFAYLGITLNLHREPVEMKPNSSLVFDYRIAVWDGEISPEIVEKEYNAYAK